MFRPSSIRLIRQRQSSIDIIDLGPASDDTTAPHRVFRPTLHAEEMEKMRRLVERPFGEAVFASAIVMGDGATERAFLPPVIRHELGSKAHGVCVIDPGSLGNDLARAVVKFSSISRTPWVAFADSDASGHDAVTALLSLSDGDATRVVWINGVNADGTPIHGAIEDMLLNHDEALCRDACTAVRADLGDMETKDMMKKLKGVVGASLAAMLIERYPDTTAWPQPLQELLARLEREL